MTAATATRAAKNGSAPVEPVFPVDSFREAAQHLRRPFTPQAVKFKVQSTAGDKAMVVAYIDARLVVERLNLIVPHLWVDAYNGPECALTIDGLTRYDIGEGQGKALRSDALKRAAVKFGIGVSLYAIPQTWLPIDGKQAKRVQGRGKDNVYMQAQGERFCRERYAKWLDDVGRQAFGDPLDHGDADGAQGDFETHPDQAPAVVDDPPITDAAREKIARALADANVDPAVLLAAAGFSSLEDVTTVAAALRVRAELDKAGA